MAPMAPIGPLNPLGTAHTQTPVHKASEQGKLQAYLQGNNDRARGKPYGTSYTGTAFGELAQAYREGYNDFKGVRK